MVTIKNNNAALTAEIIRNYLNDAKKAGAPVKFYTRDRVYIDKFRARDTARAPFTLNNYFISGGLVYYKINQFEYKNICFDDIEKIEINY